MVLMHTRLTRKTYPGFDSWLAGTACWFFGTLLVFGLRNVVPPFISIVLGNVLTYLHPAIFFDGLIKFYQMEKKWWRTPLNYALIAVLTVLYFYFSLVDDNISVRVVISTVPLTFLYGRILLEPLFYTEARHNKIQLFLSITLLPFIFMTAYRTTLYLPLSVARTYDFLMRHDQMIVMVGVYANFFTAVMTYSCFSLTSNRLEQELSEVHQALEKANKAKSAFLGMVSHEMRTPLAIISGVGEVLVKRLGGEELRDILPLMRQATGQLHRHIDDLLDLTKIESGNISLEQVSFNLPELLDEIREIFYLRIKVRGLNFLSERSPDLPIMMKGDRQRIFQIIANLFENALKSTMHGSIAASAIRKGAELVITVTDTGSGIEAEYLEKIFDPFASFSPSGGTGLGLPISRRLAEAMGGTLTAGSLPEQGSSFTLILPCFEQNLTESPDQQNLPGSTSWDKPLNVLAVDDLPENLILLTLLLADTPIVLTTVECGTDALKLLDQQHFDVLLTDIRMAGMDGITLTQRIRIDEQSSGRHPLRIIALSANAYPEDRCTALAAGCNSYLSRPFTTVSLLQEMMPITVTVEEQNIDGHAARVELQRQFEQLREAALVRIAASVTVIEQAVERGDCVTVREEGHRIKGLGMSLGIPDAESAGTALEQAGRDARLETVPELLDSLRRKSE